MRAQYWRKWHAIPRQKEQTGTAPSPQHGSRHAADGSSLLAHLSRVGRGHFLPPSGPQESDLILGPFAETFLTNLDNTQLDRSEALLDCNDPDLFDYQANDGRARGIAF